ncbi:serine/arginine-rich splicing factor 4-like isoform X2 [Sinocyclocheilus grahami]|uniref:serine/arginine-rich splicing factor 4-like isoform X2 n=1 Tax=Sinocyclocheilus grahami TaxID=75366 RepID=UPI0007AD2B79|nr:PREDICTED: serine/arginine-rich splicing factor 4-like isoform X2 [Sinocyclocheilus grahami]
MSRVYVGKLSYRAREKDVERFFKGYGKILEVDLKNGYGFVEFDDPRDADDAVCDLNGKDLCGKRVIVEHTIGQRRDGGTGSRSGRSSQYRRGGGDRYGPPTRTDYRLIVENLSSRCSWQDLKDYMRQAGEVTYADTNKGRKNEGVIEFRQYSDMKRALEKLDGTEVNGRKIRLIEDRPGARRRRSYSRSASRSRSRSRRSRRSRSHSRTSSRSRASGSRSRSRSTSKKTKGRSSRMEESSNGARRGGESARDNSTSCSPPSKKGKRENKRDRSYSRSRSRSRSKSGNDRDLSRESGSRSQEATKSGDEGRVAERAHCSRAHSRSRSQTPPDADLRRESRSKSKSRSHSRSRSYSRSRSRSRSRS